MIPLVWKLPTVGNGWEKNGKYIGDGIKAHIAIDIKTKETLAIEITDETVADSDKFDDLINQTEQNIEGRKVKRALGDGGYDDKDCFNTLDKKKIESGIKTRINASTKSRGSPYRAKCVREKEELGGYKGWISMNTVNAGLQKAYFLLWKEYLVKPSERPASTECSEKQKWSLCATIFY